MVKLEKGFWVWVWVRVRVNVRESLGRLYGMERICPLFLIALLG